MRLLFVEDSDRLRRSLGRGLQRAGFAVDLAADGREGLAYSELNDYDVIILDLMLPEVDGLTVLRTLRLRGRNTHVLILSAKDQVEDRIRGLELGADDYLVKPFSALVTLTSQSRGEVEIDFADELMPEFESPERPEYFELWLADGTRIERSRSLGNRDLPRLESLSNAPLFRNLRLPDGRPGRLVEIAFVPQPADDDHPLAETLHDPASPPGQLRSAVLVVARDRERLEALIRSFYVATVGTAVLLMAGIALLVHFAVRSGLAPLAEIGRQVQALDAERLDSRVEVQPPVRELLPVVDQLNALLSRLADAFERERRFSSDVAHELRTPVAELRSLAEVGARWPEDRDSARAFFEDARSIARQMERTVSVLLALARCEGGIEQTEMGEIVLPDLISEIWSTLAAEAHDRNLRLEVDATPVPIVSDREKLQLILSNLLSNAVTYSPAGSTVAFAARVTDGMLEIAVSNPAPHLAPEDLPRLFERFWRKDAARSNGRHAGLGLALARSLATLLGFSLTARLDSQQNLEIRLAGPVGETPS